MTAFAGRCDQAGLLGEADRNLYAAKSGGRDRTVATDQAWDGPADGE